MSYNFTFTVVEKGTRYQRNLRWTNLVMNITEQFSCLDCYNKSPEEGGSAT